MNLFWQRFLNSGSFLSHSSLYSFSLFFQKFTLLTLVIFFHSSSVYFHFSFQIIFICLSLFLSPIFFPLSIFVAQIFHSFSFFLLHFLLTFLSFFIHVFSIFLSMSKYLLNLRWSGSRHQTEGLCYD